MVEGEQVELRKSPNLTYIRVSVVQKLGNSQLLTVSHRIWHIPRGLTIVDMQINQIILSAFKVITAAIISAMLATRKDKENDLLAS